MAAQDPVKIEVVGSSPTPGVQAHTTPDHWSGLPADSDRYQALGQMNPRGPCLSSVSRVSLRVVLTLTFPELGLSL